MITIVFIVAISTRQKNCFLRGCTRAKNRHGTKIQDSRREVTAYELRLDYERREATFFLRFFVTFRRKELIEKRIDLKKENKPKNKPARKI